MLFYRNRLSWRSSPTSFARFLMVRVWSKTQSPILPVAPRSTSGMQAVPRDRSLKEGGDGRHAFSCKTCLKSQTCLRFQTCQTDFVLPTIYLCFATYRNYVIIV